MCITIQSVFAIVYQGTKTDWLPSLISSISELSSHKVSSCLHLRNQKSWEIQSEDKMQRCAFLFLLEHEYMKNYETYE